MLWLNNYLILWDQMVFSFNCVQCHPCVQWRGRDALVITVWGDDLTTSHTCLLTTPQPFFTLHCETTHTDIRHAPMKPAQHSLRKRQQHISIPMVLVSKSVNIQKVEQKAQVNRSLWSVSAALDVLLLFYIENTQAFLPQADARP